jgi:prepilin-type N-terminal cleavage/methylation domain-containing protein
MRRIKIKAFTLIELLVVIAIIGILSALIIVGVSSTTQKATIAKSQVFANSLRNSLMSNIVSEWKFESGSHTTGQSADATDTKDSWGSNDAVNVLGPTIKEGTDCVTNKCLSFDGGDYIEFSDISLSEGINKLTISVWAYSNPSETYRTVISKGYYTSGSWELRMTNDGAGPVLYFGVVTAGGIVRSSSSFQNSSWHNVVGVYDGVKTYIYYDGALKDSDPQTGNIVDTAITVKLGHNGASGEYWIGKIDDVRLYDAASPISQIQQNYFVGINKLFNKNQISGGEYQKRIAELISNYAKN